MKVVILAGGFGTRISEESHLKPKPMIEIGGKPILWHIMKIYSQFGFNDFIICLGYKGYYIKEYFAHYYLHQSDITFDFTKGNELVIHNHHVEPWKVTLVDTGASTMTGGRIKRVESYVGNETFMMTYGDGVSNVNIDLLIKHHREKGKLATVTAVQPLGRYGAMNFQENCIIENFQEKPRGDGGWINAGFFVFEPGVFKYISGDDVALEGEPLEKLAAARQIAAYKHDAFWQPMDTMRDKLQLEKLWETGSAPWKSWK